jgi:Rod binding domain-containing protein
VAEQFEGMFLHMMLKEMRKTVPESVFFDSPSMKLFQDMQDQQVALDLAKEGPLGLATMLKANIAQQQGVKNRLDKPEGFALNPQAKSFAVNAPSKSFAMPQTQSVPRALNAYQAIELVR